MNELPVIGEICMRKKLWDRQGQTLQVAKRKSMAKTCFYVEKKGFLTEINALSPMDLGNDG